LELGGGFEGDAVAHGGGTDQSATRRRPPASVLTDNGAIFTGAPGRGGRTALDITLGTLGSHA
jgi:hypothetical protein